MTSASGLDLRDVVAGYGGHAPAGPISSMSAMSCSALPLWLAAVAGAMLFAVIAVAIDWLAFRPLRHRSGVTLLVASMDVAIALVNIIRFFAGNSPRAYDVAVARPIWFGDLRVNHEQLTILITVVAALAMMWIVFRFTRLGRMMRAVADNPDLAAVRGISRSRVVAYVWLISGSLVAVSGVLVGLCCRSEVDV